MNHEPNFIHQLKEGNEETFRLFFIDHKELVYNTALHLLQNEEDAMDVMQEVFLEVILSVNRFKGDSSLSTWVYRICVNKSLNQLRRRKVRNFNFLGSNPSLATQSGIQWTHPGVLLENKEKSQKLYATIAKLKSKERVSFTLFHIQGLPQKEIAEITEQSVAAVETQIFRAKKKLSQWLLDEKT